MSFLLSGSFKDSTTPHTSLRSHSQAGPPFPCVEVQRLRYCLIISFTKQRPGLTSHLGLAVQGEKGLLPAVKYTIRAREMALWVVHLPRRQKDPSLTPP